MTLVALAASGGCTEPNAVLELRLDLPPVPDGDARRYAFTQVRRASATSFAALWEDSSDLEGAALSTSRTMDHISVESVGDDDAFDLKVRVRFCSDVACSALEDDLALAPRECFVIRHPFYVGRRTEVLLTIDTVPTGGCDESDAAEIGRCMVRGCIGGDATTNYCREGDGPHICEG